MGTDAAGQFCLGPGRITWVSRRNAYHTSFDTQRGLLVGFSHKKAEFTTYIFNPGWSDPTLVLELPWSF